MKKNKNILNNLNKILRIQTKTYKKSWKKKILKKKKSISYKNPKKIFVWIFSGFFYWIFLVFLELFRIVKIFLTI
jgi:hypothetical protein